MIISIIGIGNVGLKAKDLITAIENKKVNIITETNLLKDIDKEKLLYYDEAVMLDERKELNYKKGKEIKNWEKKNFWE